MSQQSPRFPLFPLVVLSSANFVAVSAEFLPTGLLPDMAHDLGVSESQVGLLVTLFAGTVVVSTAPLTALVRRIARKTLIVALLGVFALGLVLAAVAPNYGVLAAARVLGGLAHGVFWAVSGPYAARLVEPRHLARAVAVTNAGGTLAFILGVPVGTALGHALGWRLAFGAMAVVVAVFLVLVVLRLPPVSHLVPLATGEIPIPAFKDRTLPAIIIVCVTTVLVMLGQNAFSTYVAVWTTDVGEVAPDLVSVVLFVNGLFGAIGLLLVGLLGDRFPRAVFVVGVGLSAVAIAAAAFVGRGLWGVIAVFAVWNVAFGGIAALMHARMLHSASLRLRDIGAAWLTTSFNAAIGSGALLGGALLDAWGVEVLPWVAAGLFAAGLAWALATDRARIAAAQSGRPPTSVAANQPNQPPSTGTTS